MRIAFDLDDTLIPSRLDLFPVERPRGFVGRFFASEWLRRGALDLMHALVRHRCDLWVYTTSSRTPRYNKDLFRWYGVRLGGAINQEIHWEWLKQQPLALRCSKYPPAFGIDLLIDDSEVVWMEGSSSTFVSFTSGPTIRIGCKPLWRRSTRAAPPLLYLAATEADK